MLRRSRPRFSVVIPCFNEAPYLGAALNSLEQQDFEGGYEIIVVDNNCTDETVAIAHKHNVKVVTEVRRGVCWARQAGTKAAEGEIIISTDADTTFARNWLSKIDKIFQADPQLLAVGGMCKYKNAPWWGRLYPKLLFGFIYVYYKLTGRVVYLTATNISFRKSAWEGYDTSLTQGGDELDLLHQFRRKGKVVFTLRLVVYTSARRLIHGLWYNIFVSFLYYYFVAYHVNKLFKRRVIGSAPVYRQETVPRLNRAPLFAAGIFLMLITGVLSMNDRAYAATHSLVKGIIRAIK